MNVGIISGGEGWHVRDLARALVEVGHEPVFVRFQDLQASSHSARTLLRPMDVALIRSIPAGTLEQTIFRLNVLHRLEAEGLRIVNGPVALETCVDKYLCSAKLAAAGLPTPVTQVCQTSAQALSAVSSLGGDCVIKPLFGSEGRGIVRVSDRETAWRVFQAWERVGAVFYVQPFLAGKGYDLRALVLDGKVLAAMRRWAPQNGWITNISQGGRAEAVSLTAQEATLAVQAAEVTGATVAGVDLLPVVDGTTYVLEVNGVPGWRALGSVSQLDVAQALVRLALNPRTKLT